MILKRVDCGCGCPNTVFEREGPRCPKCHHLVKIRLTDEWTDPFVWIDPRTHAPVKVDEILPSTG